MTIINLFIFSFCLTSYSIDIIDSSFMIYWLTSHSNFHLTRLFHQIKLFRSKQLEKIDFQANLCYIKVNGRFLHSISFDYVKVEKLNPLKIEIVEYRIHSTYILVSFNITKSKIKKKKFQNRNMADQCNRTKSLSLFNCNISYETNHDEIFSFDQQCYILFPERCIKDLVKISISEEQKSIINYFHMQYRKRKRKSCRFRNITFNPQIIDYISTTGNISFTHRTFSFILFNKGKI